MNPFLRVACLATVLSCPLTAAPVSVGDFSFEGNALTAGQWNNNLDPEWKETAGPNNGNGFEEFISGFVADGTDHLGMEINHDVWQDLAVTYQANTRYTLTVATGNRSGSTQAGNQSPGLPHSGESSFIRVWRVFSQRAARIRFPRMVSLMVWS